MTKTSTILWGVALSCVLTLQTKLWADSDTTPVPASTFKQVYDLGGKLLVDETLDVTGRIKTYKDVIASTGTFGLVTATSGTIKSFMVVGTGTNDSAPTGRMGEKIESVVGATNFPSTGVMGDLTSISLTPGDWNVSALLAASRNGATITEVSAGISVNSGTSGVGLVDGNTNAHTTGPTATNRTFIVIPDVAMSVSVATTVYLKYTADFTVATPQATGRLTARRPR